MSKKRKSTDCVFLMIFLFCKKSGLKARKRFVARTGKGDVGRRGRGN